MMKMVTRIAMDNTKYHRSRNILTGIAIFLTTLLLLVVPMVARGIIAIQFTETNAESLGTNYLDPSMVSIVAGIMAVIMFAGVITIYSIYYVSLSQRVREFGRIKAIGATRRQLKQIVLREGLFVAGITIPIGLAVGTVISFIILTVLKGQSFGGYGLKVDLFAWWVYPIAVAVTFVAVCISLLKPMRVLSGVSEVEAMRYHDTNRGRAEKKGHSEITVGRLVWNNLMGNRKKCLMTICSMSITGVFFMVMATVLSGAKPEDVANEAVVGQYVISINAEEGNVEHPEWAWSDVVKHNPLDEEFKNRLLALDGVNRVDTFMALNVTGKIFGKYGETITGFPEEYASELEASIVEGGGTYEDLKSGDKIMVDRGMLKWYPNLQAGSVVTLTVHDGERCFEKAVEVIAIVDMRYGIYAGGKIIMANEAVEKLCKYNHAYNYSVIAKENYNKELENAIAGLLGGNEQAELLTLDTWQLHYEMAKGSLVSSRTGCYAMLGILYVISIMNLINTMINSVHVRRKEIGMLQAIGMSDRQLMKMLQLEGLFYTVGTLLISVGGGSLLGYPVFLMMKKKGIFCAINYHYPVAIAVILSVTLIFLQVVLAAGLARSVKGESLIDRVRFGE